MILQDQRSRETIDFIETLERLTELIKKTLSVRTPVFNGEKYLTNKDLETFLHMSPRLLQIYRTDGILPYIKISGKILYKESDVIKLLEENYCVAQNPSKHL